MGRRAALESAVRARLMRHSQDVRTQLPLAGGAKHAARASSDGIRLSADGSLSATLTFQDIHAVETTVTLRANPGGGVEEFDGRGRQSEASTRSAGAHVLDESDERLGVVTALAREHLPSDAAEEFLALLRPALRLVHAGEDDPVIAQLGGLPTVAVNSWPVWDGHGPLAHVLSFDCAPVAALLPELGLPTDGRMAFFYYDAPFDDADGTVGSWDPATRPGFHVRHLHPELSTRANITDAATPAPPGVPVYPAVPLTAVRTMTWPSFETPMIEAAWHRCGLIGPRPGVPADQVKALYDALWKLPGSGYDTHQIGGHPCPQQGPVELEVEQLRHGLEGLPFAWGDPAMESAAAGWQLLLQVASDDTAAMMWGDVGQLYYLVRDAQRPEEALFTWQCG
ncbi:hypothetical protein GCM10027053_46590 [Intrasporangium mesophilum]